MKAIRCTNGECDFVHNGVCCNDLVKKSTECKSHNQRKPDDKCRVASLRKLPTPP